MGVGVAMLKQSAMLCRLAKKKDDHHCGSYSSRKEPSKDARLSLSHLMGTAWDINQMPANNTALGVEVS